jgi:hypothetical protein
MGISPEAPPRMMRRWLWRLMIAGTVPLLGILLALTSALWGPYCLGRVLSAYLQTSDIVGGMTGGWWSGLTIRELTITERTTPQAPLLMRVDKLTVDLSLASLLFSTKPITVWLHAVHIDLRQRQDGVWNLTPVLKALETSTPARPDAGANAPRLNRLVTVTVTRGTLRIGKTTELTDLAIGLHWAAGRLTVTQAEARMAGGVVALQGEVSLQHASLDQVLQWRLGEIHLDRLLGPAFQHVMIAEATGRLTPQGDGFGLETSVRVPMFTLAPGTLGQHQPHLTHVVVTCTLEPQPPFTHVGAEACRLHASEAQLSLRGSTVDLVSKPQLTLQVDGSLAGRLVGELAPEVPGEFPDPVHIKGQITIPFREPVWLAMGWHLAVSSERVVFDDSFTEVHTTVVKSVDQIEVSDLRARRGTGLIHGAGAWRLAEPVEGSLEVQVDGITLRRVLAHGTTGGPYLVEGTLSGTVAWRMDHNGEHLTVDGHVHPMHLRHAAATIIQVPEGRVQVKLGRDRDGCAPQNSCCRIPFSGYVRSCSCVLTSSRRCQLIGADAITRRKARRTVSCSIFMRTRLCL